MIQFTKINIEGFCSIDRLSLDLNTQGITIIRGANGFGKSTIFSALVWAIYGKNIKGGGNGNVNTWDKFRPKNYKGTKVEVYFNKDHQIHRIIRCLNYKGEVEGAKGNSRLIYEIDANPVEDKYKNKIQDIIVDNLGMSYNLFINSVMFGQGLTRLIESSGSDQKKLFEEIFETEYLTKARDIAKEEYDKYNQEYSNMVYKKDLLEKQIKNLKNSLEYAEKYEKVEKQKRKEKEEALRTEKVGKKKDLARLVENLDKDRQQAIPALIEEHREMIQRNQEKLDKAKAEVGIPLEELINKTIELLEKKEYDSSLNYLRNLKSAFSKIDSCQSKIYTLNKALSRLKDERNRLQILDEKIKRLKDSLKNIRRSLKDLKRAPLPKQSNNFQKQIEDYQRELDNLDLSHISNNRDLYKWAYTDPLGNNGIKAFLFESSLDSLNQSLEAYSNILGFSIVFGVDLESTRKDFHIYINLDGQDVPFEDLSGGQKQLVNLAIAFAMNEIMSQSKEVNIAFLDEVFESLSQNNIELVSELIRKIYKNKTLFLITHQESLPIHANVLRVTRVNGLSHYEF